MRTLQMITVSDDYLPYAGSGRNTIRKYSTKYQALAVGEHLVMHHTDDPKTTGATNATELLQVASIAIAPLGRLISHHGLHNVIWVKLLREALDTEDDFEDGLLDDRLHKKILSFYPVPEGEERNLEELYCAIYF